MRPVIATTAAAIIGSGILAMTAMLDSASAASVCKGLADAACGGNSACQWMPARVAGQPSPTSGKPYSRNQKAHCRPAAKAKTAAAATAPATK